MKNNRLAWVALGISLGAILVLAQTGGTAQPAPQAGRGGRGGRSAHAGRKVLLIWADTRNGVGQHESTAHAMATIERLGYESGLYDSYIRTDSEIIAKQPLTTTGQPASGGPSLSNVDAIFCMTHRDAPLTDQQKADLLAFVHDDGKGFIGAHVATTAFLSWPEFGDMIGGQFDQHPYGTTAGTIINDAPDFPATKQFPASFPFVDEFYQTQNFSREKMRVLMRLDMSKMPANSGVHRTDGDWPLAWAKMYGKGRVFYSSLGHAAATWDNPDIYHMYFEAIKWALGLSDGDITPRPYPGSAPASGGH